jgi:integrase
MAKRRTFGSTRRLPSGRWQARYQLVDGSSIPGPSTFETRELADRWLATQHSERGAGTWVDPRDGLVTLDACAELWAEARTGRPSTVVRDRGYVERYLRAGRLADLGLGKITPALIRGWVADLDRDGLAPATIVKAGQLLGAILDQAVADRCIPSNPARLVSWPKVEQAELRVLTGPEIDGLVEAIDARYRLLVRLGLTAGLRIGEMCALRAGDVDPLRRTVRVERTLVEVEGMLVENPPKTRAGLRTVPIGADLADDLAVYLAGAHRDDLVWEAPKGDGPIRLASWRTRFWRPATETAGLAGFRVHDMRHTAVSAWIRGGVDPTTVARWAGHASVVSVFARYGHAIPRPDDSATFDRVAAMLDAERKAQAKVVGIDDGRRRQR